jgi:hypothetical protein
VKAVATRPPANQRHKQLTNADVGDAKDQPEARMQRLASLHRRQVRGARFSHCQTLQRHLRAFSFVQQFSGQERREHPTRALQMQL